MVEKDISLSGDVVDLARYQAERRAIRKASAVSARACRHCGAALLDGENEDDCSSAFNVEVTFQQGRQ
jgi:hypothetical protein